METNLVILNEENIKDKIYTIRGKQVMIDSDLATIYGYTTKAFNQQVERNIERFGIDFRFQLSNEEVKILSRSQNVTSMQTKGIKGGRVYNPYVFTEEGIYMLMTVLKGELAIKQSKALIRIFKNMKDYIITNNILNQDYINQLVLRHDEKINELFNRLEPQINSKIFFSHQTNDAYSLLINILESAKKEIIVLDNYIDRKILDLISKTETEVIIVSKNMQNELIEKYQEQYSNLTIKVNDEFHDRFIIIDRKMLYSIGSSLKDLGKKCFAITKIESSAIISSILDKINI